MRLMIAAAVALSGSVAYCQGIPAQGLTIKGAHCLPVDQQQRIAARVQQLLIRFSADEDVKQMNTAREEMSARNKATSECAAGPSIFNPLGALLSDCSKTVAEYNYWVGVYNNAESHAKFNQETLNSQLQILRSTYGTCP